MDNYQIPWQWPWHEHLSKMKIFWKHWAIFLPHPFATELITNSNETLSTSFHAKGQHHINFLGTSRRVPQSCEILKQDAFFMYFELFKLQSITENFLLLTPAWKIESPDVTHTAPACTVCLHWYQPCYKPTRPSPLLPSPTLIFSALSHRQLKEGLSEAGVTIRWWKGITEQFKKFQNRSKSFHFQVSIYLVVLLPSKECCPRPM